MKRQIKWGIFFAKQVSAIKCWVIVWDNGIYTQPRDDANIVGYRTPEALKLLHYLDTVYKLEFLIQEIRVRGLLSHKIMEFTFVNDCFYGKRNDEIGLYGQTLFKEMHRFALNR